MKIVSNFLESVAGIEVFPLVSFMIFFLFFLGVTIYVIRLDKNYIREVSNYPLATDQNEKTDNEIFNL